MIHNWVTKILNRNVKEKKNLVIRWISNFYYASFIGINVWCFLHVFDAVKFCKFWKSIWMSKFYFITFFFFCWYSSIAHLLKFLFFFHIFYPLIHFFFFCDLCSFLLKIISFFLLFVVYSIMKAEREKKGKKKKELFSKTTTTTATIWDELLCYCHREQSMISLNCVSIVSTFFSFWLLKHSHFVGYLCNSYGNCFYGICWIVLLVLVSFLFFSLTRLVYLLSMIVLLLFWLPIELLNLIKNAKKKI